MSDKAKKFQRAKIVYLLLSAVMAISLLGAIVGIPALFVNQHVGATLIAYGLVIAFVVSSFYFISRTRYLKAKIAYQAIQIAHSQGAHRPHAE